LGVSRTPIREAIRDLAAEDLVDFDSYRSATVHVPTLAEAREIYELRLTVEPLAVRRAGPRIGEEALARARAIHAAMLAADHAVGAWVLLNRDVHAVLLDPAGAPRLLAIIAGLRNSAAIQVALSIRANPARIDEGNADHRRLIEA